MEGLSVDSLSYILRYLLEMDPIGALRLSGTCKTLAEKSSRALGSQRGAFFRELLSANVHKIYTNPQAALLFMHSWGARNGLFLRWRFNTEPLQLEKMLMNPPDIDEDDQTPNDIPPALIETPMDTLNMVFEISKDQNPDTIAIKEKVERLASRMRGEGRVVIDQAVHDVFQELLPAGPYLVSNCVRTFKLETAGEQDRDRRDASYMLKPELLFSDGTSAFNFMERIGWPITCNAPSCEPGAQFYSCPESLLFAVPLQQRLDRRVVDSYIERMRRDEGYLPCALLLSPWAAPYMGDPRGRYGNSAVLLDGHHKMRAAAELHRPVQFLLVQQRDPLYARVTAFPWAPEDNPTRLQAYQYIAETNEPGPGNSNGAYSWDERRQCCIYIENE